MQYSKEISTATVTEKETTPMSSNWSKFLYFVVILTLAFSLPLYKLFTFATASSLYSYIILIPLVSVYLGWTRRTELPPEQQPKPASRTTVIAALVTGLSLFIANLILHGLSKTGHLSLLIASFLLLLYAGCFWFLDRNTLRALTFPLGFLVFMIPFPKAVEDFVISFLQHGSAQAAHILFVLSGTSVVCNDTNFQLPGFSLQVAPECSGIHSTLVLFITSTVGSWLFLRTPWKRSVLLLAIIPLALLRNGFRVFVIAMLCIHVNPQMINSPIHHHGGPIFFILSLIPFFFLLYFFYKSDRKKAFPSK